MKQVFLSLLAAGVALAAEPRPNFLVIMGEAQGWASMSVPLDDRNPEGSRSDFIRTPNLDGLAERAFVSLIFTRPHRAAHRPGRRFSAVAVRRPCT